MGTMSYYPNIDAVLYFAESIFPLILAQDPDISWCIAGREPPKIVRQLAEGHPQIEIVANPEDMSAIASQCSLSVVPLRSGSGTRIKILHSMAMGLPVITTNIGCEGLEATNREHLLIRDCPENFARAVLELIGDRQMWQQLQLNGRQLVQDKYDWTAIFADYEAKLIEMSSKLTGNRTGVAL